jgi:hypothetical protein
MASKTNYLQAALINAVVRNIAYTTVTPVYVGLFTAAPDDAYTAGVPTGTEVAGNAYARQTIAFGAPAGAPETALNSGIVNFPAATPAGWGVITSFGIFDAVGAGANLLYWATLTANKTVNAGDVFQFAVGSISLAEN